MQPSNVPRARPLLGCDHVSRGAEPPQHILITFLLQCISPLIVYALLAGGARRLWAATNKHVEPLPAHQAWLLLGSSILNEIFVLIDQIFVWHNGSFNSVFTIVLVLVLFHGSMHTSIVLFAFIAEPSPRMTLIGAITFSAGTILEQVADWQLSSFVRAKPDNKVTQRVMTTGLWGFSRHPNYLGSVIKWTGFALLSGSAVITLFWCTGIHFVLCVQSIPAQEAYMSKRYEDEWVGYVHRVPRLYSWPFVRGYTHQHQSSKSD